MCARDCWSRDSHTSYVCWRWCSPNAHNIWEYIYVRACIQHMHGVCYNRAHANMQTCSHMRAGWLAGTERYQLKLTETNTQTRARKSLGRALLNHELYTCVCGRSVCVWVSFTLASPSSSRLASQPAHTSARMQAITITNNVALIMHSRAVAPSHSDAITNVAIQLRNGPAGGGRIACSMLHAM